MGLVAVAVMVSCQQDSKWEQLDNDAKSTNIVSLETAKDVAFYYLHKNKNVPNTRSRQADDVKIENTFSINDNDENPVMHIINYEGGGFAIISGDNRIEPMLAYSDEGAFDDNEFEYPEGLTLWINHIKSVVGHIRNNDVAAPEEIINHWEVSEMYGKSRAIPDISTDCEAGERFNDSSVGPLMSSIWGQTYPFNETMPIVSCGDNFVRARVGCVFVAMGQVMKYWEYPTNYNWNNIPNTTATSTTHGLLNDLHAAYEKYDNILYECDTTSANNAYIPNVLINEFGYKSAIRANYSSTTVRNELLTYQRPTILRGVSTYGHAWVCDGAHEWYVCDDSSSGIAGAYYYLHLHMNWGYNGLYDGWYSSSNFHIPATGNTFDSGLIMIYNIVPN